MIDAARPRRLLVSVTVPETAVAFLGGQLDWMESAGWSVTLVTSPGVPAERFSPGLDIVEVPMARAVSPGADLRSLLRLVRVLGRHRPAVVNAGTPKAGLLVGLAAWLLRVPRRVYTIRGLPLETRRGAIRAVLWLAEWLAIHTAQTVICVSPSLRDRIVALRLTDSSRVVVIGEGSSNGVDVDRFADSPAVQDAARSLRAALGVPEQAPVVGFVGRLARDKGVPELVRAWPAVAARHPQAWLVLVGDDEPGDPVGPETEVLLRTTPHICRTGWVDRPEVAYRSMDILVLPTHREGFPNVVLEAAACGLPVITTTATGARDAVRPGTTGLRVPSGDSEALAAAIEQLLDDPGRAREMGAAGHRWVVTSFVPRDIWAGIEGVYLSTPTRSPSKTAT